jgi:hypothetical protein
MKCRGECLASPNWRAADLDTQRGKAIRFSQIVDLSSRRRRDQPTISEMKIELMEDELLVIKTVEQYHVSNSETHRPPQLQTSKHSPRMPIGRVVLRASARMDK